MSKIMRHFFGFSTLFLSLSIAMAGDDTTQTVDLSDADSTPPRSAFFDQMREVMTGRWEGRYTNGTFAEPTSWNPVTIEYRQTSNGTAIVENYYSTQPEFSDMTAANMTTVYHKDRDDLRLTHYCGAANHPSMMATALNADDGLVTFDFTHITNLSATEDYHSRKLNLDIVSPDHIRIEYHGIQDGKIYSQAYDVTRVVDTS